MRRSAIAYFTLCFLVSIFSSEACRSQDSWLNFEIESGVGFSVGSVKYQTERVADSLSVRSESQLLYNNPIFDIGLNIRKSLNRLTVGIGISTHITLNQDHPVITDDFNNRVYLPVEAQLGYYIPITEDLKVYLRGTFGYSFMQERYLYRSWLDEFYMEIDGGINGSFMISVGTIRILDLHVSPKVEYNFTRFKSTLNSYYFDRFNFADTPDKYSYFTDYHFLSCGLIFRSTKL